MSYAKLRGKIKEVFGTDGAFAEAMGKDASTISGKLNNKTPWTSDEIPKACQLLGIAITDVYLYFFTPEVEKTQR